MHGLTYVLATSYQGSKVRKVEWQWSYLLPEHEPVLTRSLIHDMHHVPLGAILHVTYPVTTSWIQQTNVFLDFEDNRTLTFCDCLTPCHSLWLVYTQSDLITVVVEKHLVNDKMHTRAKTGANPSWCQNRFQPRTRQICAASEKQLHRHPRIAVCRWTPGNPLPQ